MLRKRCIKTDQVEGTAEGEAKGHVSEGTSHPAIVQRKKPSEKENLKTASRDTKTTQKKPRGRECRHTERKHCQPTCVFKSEEGQYRLCFWLMRDASVLQVVVVHGSR